ncbi:sphingolipid long chain base-responsive protein PIL1 [Plectosphaerella plurivora]|uniref:Sphingolipid long chain base-responsive protein PIL1 n=1 Tax=Plectosphaerella plurivora TaxID=936078 RepID=A0A9P9AF50_9PEZI|nr:sphingolipid long chain base-responsive protein PIL1 [Plectosphaerella plurivora]
MNRSLSIRSGKSRGGSSNKPGGGFSFSSLRGNIQPELSRRLYRIIKLENNLIQAHEQAARERQLIATQLSEWGEHTNDDAINDISDKIGVVLSEIGELEDSYAHAIDDSRAHLKSIRNTEKSVQPSRDGKSKIADEIGKLKMKEPESAKLVVLEQELVRAEAENLVAEAQLSNITREKLKQTYEAEFAATIERAEKQILLAKHGRRLLTLLDDAPVAPGDPRRVYPHAQQARQILNDCEDDLRDWQPQLDDFSTEPTQGQGLLRQGTDGSGSLLSNDSTRGGGSQKPRSRAIDDEEDMSVAATEQRSDRADVSALNASEQSEAAQIRA